MSKPKADEKNFKRTRYDGHVSEKDRKGRERRLARLAKNARTYASESHPED